MNLRIGTLNVRSMSKRSGEVTDMVARRRLDFCCLRETKWKGGSAARGHLVAKVQCTHFSGQDVKMGCQVYEFWLLKDGLIKSLR